MVLRQKMVLEDSRRERLRLLLRSCCAGDTPAEQVYTTIQRLYPGVPDSMLLEQLARLRLLSSSVSA